MTYISRTPSEWNVYMAISHALINYQVRRTGWPVNVSLIYSHDRASLVYVSGCDHNDEFFNAGDEFKMTMEDFEAKDWE